MSGGCEELERCLEGGLDEAEEARWREHLAGCADCREQSLADAFLRQSFTEPPPELSTGFEARPRRRLEERAASTARRPGRLAPSGLWALAAYGTAALAAAVVILARLPWQSLAPSPVWGITLGALALLSPLALLDRVGIVRPPG